ncbi:ABC transporter ATP-binding protein [Piscinibacter sp.]|uniref:ABC transporter ATP-binding protein n=1 Tax=Piscinibacter sp. TaxID=1903157 RepID=UPI002C59F4D7|nr:ATP-binding cassette domain-containing protein [Albitalea sp.]HUG21912.1 ATP-binding cassette domain-containing protein [Albitalea sp.]
MNALLEVKDLHKSFGGLRAVSGLSFTVRPGEVLGLLGPNGSGKTTALNLVSGALAAGVGSIRLDGKRIDGLAAHRIAHAGVARTFQLVRVLPGMSCIENVQVAMAFRREPSFGASSTQETTEHLERVGLSARAHVLAGELTYIDQKRLELARALALRPRLLLLDEWLAGLNPTELQQGIGLIAALRAGGLTVVLVEHVMDAVRALCDRCVVMSAGACLAEGPTASVLSDPAVVDVYLGRAHA